MNKYSEYIANSWEEYSGQGPAYKKIQDWWDNNWDSLDDVSSPDYNEWSNWYKEKFYNSWNGIHRGPEEALKELISESNSNLNSEINNDNTRQRRIGDRRKKVKDMTVRKLPRGSDLPNKNPGVNLNDLSQNALELLRTITSTSKSIGAEIPHVTSGHRSSSAQARVMSSNWNDHGGKTKLTQDELSLLGSNMIASLNAGLEGRPITKGMVYLYNLYQMKTFAFFVNNTLYDYGINRESRNIISDWIIANVPLTSHMAKPATSFDLKLTKDIKNVLDIVKNSNEFNMKILYEGNHYHVSVS
jgi:hypothetical protein